MYSDIECNEYSYDYYHNRLFFLWDYSIGLLKFKGTGKKCHCHIV